MTLHDGQLSKRRGWNAIGRVRDTVEYENSIEATIERGLDFVEGRKSEMVDNLRESYPRHHLWQVLTAPQAR